MAKKAGVFVLVKSKLVSQWQQTIKAGVTVAVIVEDKLASQWQQTVKTSVTVTVKKQPDVMVIGKKQADVMVIGKKQADVIVIVKLLFVDCITSQLHASISQGRICSDNFTCYHTEIEVADPTFYLTQSQYTDTGPTIPGADPIMPCAWQGSHWSANF